MRPATSPSKRSTAVASSAAEEAAPPAAEVAEPAACAPAAAESSAAAGSSAPSPAALPKQASTDGATRAFAAMSLFSAAKAAYDKLDKLEAESGKPGSMAEAREALHSKFAAKALALAHSQGGVYVKAAQFIASLQGGSGGGGVPAAYTSTLAALTDRAAPHDLSLLSPLIEEELRTKDWVGEPTGGATPIFARVETPAVAAASLSQVHRAQMADGTWMALKLQFPWLAEQLPADFQVFRMISSMLKPGGFDVGWMVADLEAHVTSELDFLAEAAHADDARAALGHRCTDGSRDIGDGGAGGGGVGAGRGGGSGDSGGRADVLIPRVVIRTRRLLATQWVPNLLRVDAGAAQLRRAGVDPRVAASLVADVLMGEMPLRHAMVHGDPHAGNVYLRAVQKGGEEGVKAGVNSNGGNADASASDNTGVNTVSKAGVKSDVQLVLLDHGLYHRLPPTLRLSLCRLVLECARPWPSPCGIRRLAEPLAKGLWPLLPLLLSPAFALGTGLRIADLDQAAQGRVPDSIGYDQIWRTLVEIHQGGTAHAGAPATAQTGNQAATATPNPESQSAPSEASGPATATLTSSPGTALLGYLHSLGYVKGLLNSLGCGEQTRVLAMARHAALALAEAREAAGHPEAGASSAPACEGAAGPPFTQSGLCSPEERLALAHLLDPAVPPLWLVVLRVQSLFLLLWLLRLVVGAAKQASNLLRKHREEVAVVALASISLGAAATFTFLHGGNGSVA